MTILAIGVRGHIVGAVLNGLLAAGETVRASSRNPKPDDFPDGVEAVRAHLADPLPLQRVDRGAGSMPRLEKQGHHLGTFNQRKNSNIQYDRLANS